MSIKGLFSRNENNDEINQLIKRVKTLELKTNSLDVHMKRLVKLEQEWRLESFSTKYKKDNYQELPLQTEKRETSKREESAVIQKNLYSQLSKYISQALSPINQEIEVLEDRMFAMEMNFLEIKELLMENQEQTIQLKNEIDRMKEVGELAGRVARPVVIRELRVDKITLDKYEQNNNIGTLGIKDLGGELNIGATYGKSAIPAGMADKLLGDIQDYVTEAKQEAESANGESDETNSDSDNDVHGETSKEQYNGGHNAYFGDQQQKDEDNTDGFVDIPIK